MVAVALLAVIIVGLLAMFYQVQRAFRSGTAQADVLESGRSAVAWISKELQEISPTAGSTQSFSLLIEIVNPPLSQEIPGGVRENITEDVSFLTHQNDRWRGVAYRMVPDGTNFGTLMRAVYEGGDTNIDQITKLAAGAVITNGDFHRLADGVVHFTITPYNTTGAPLFPTPGPAGAIVYPNLTNELPRYVELELGILEPKVLESVRARIDNWTVATNYLARKAGQVHLFRQRIPIRNAP